MLHIQKRQRVNWDGGTKTSLAKEIAKVMVSLGHNLEDFDQAVMMKIFREVQPTVIRDPRQQRNILGPSQVKWLEPLVKIELNNLLNPPEPSSPLPTDNTLEYINASMELMMESLGSILHKLEGIELQQKMHHEEIVNLRNTLRAFDGEIQGLTSVIIKRKARMAERRKLTSIPPPAPSNRTEPIRVLVAGLHADRERYVDNAMKGLNDNLKIFYDDAQGKHANELPKCDKLIIMKWVSGLWKKRAAKIYSDNMFIASGTTKVVELLNQFANE